MAVLSNGIETVELGSTAWRVVINNNFEALATKAEVNSRAVDITFTSNTKGVVLKDRSSGTNYRLYVDGGTLSIEAI